MDTFKKEVHNKEFQLTRYAYHKNNILLMNVYLNKQVFKELCNMSRDVIVIKVLPNRILTITL